MHSDDHSPPALPAWKAFMVQFTHDARPHGAHCAGRVEHLSSGRRLRFDSAAELLAALDLLVAELGRLEGDEE